MSGLWTAGQESLGSKRTVPLLPGRSGVMRDISLHVLDIANNSLAAGANVIEISVEEDTKDNILVVRIIDNGKGMDKETVKKAVDPFYTSRKTRKVGLGLPLLKASCDRCGGAFSIKSEPGKGTEIYASFQYDNIDRPPLGDMPETIFSLVILNPSIDFLYRHSYNGQVFTMDTRELKEVLQGLPLNTPEVADWLCGHLKEGVSNLASKS
jgi:anti-sigma regulatory factor (Ser/Thr protein kinase)